METHVEHGSNRHLRPETSLTETLQRLGNDGRLLVIGEGQRVQGALSRDELMRLLEVHRALST
jgi:hypothetical protein